MHTKDKGSLAEAKFLVKAAELGFGVLVPWGDNRPYDLVLEKEGYFFRVQIKSCYAKQYTKPGVFRYCCNVKLNSHHKVRYTSSTVDIVAVYIEPEDLWYIIPSSFLDSFSGTTLQFYPTSKNSSTAASEPFREKWELLSIGERSEKHVSCRSSICQS